MINFTITITVILLFLFLCGLEIDIRRMKKRIKESSEENERLKQQNKELQGKYDKQLWTYNGLGCEYDWLKEENEQLKQRCKELRNDLIDHSALIKMLEDAKALDIEDMIWNTMDYRIQTEFDDDFADYREDAKKRWRE